MSNKTVEFIREYCKSKGWGQSDGDVEEVLIEAKRVYREELSQHRWYNWFLYVVDIEGKLVGYEWGECTGDTSLRDMDIKIDLSQVEEYESFEKSITAYRPKEK